MSLLPPDAPTPADILRESLAGDAEPTPGKRRGRPPRDPDAPRKPTFDAGAALERINERLDDLLVRVNALCNAPVATPDPSALDRIAVALEAIAGGRIVLAPTPATQDVRVEPVTPRVKVAPAPAPEPAPVSTPAPAPEPTPATPAVEDVRAAAVAFVEKWGRDVLVGILAKHSTTGKLSDLRDPPAFMAALQAYDKKAGA